MSDITMCQDKECPSASLCYRNTAKPNPFRQSYADFGRLNGANRCAFFVLFAIHTTNPTGVDRFIEHDMEQSK